MKQNTLYAVIAIVVLMGIGLLIIQSHRPTDTGEYVPPSAFPHTYESADGVVSVQYPDGYTVDSTYQYNLSSNTQPDMHIGGVKFTIPMALATGTNLGADTYISVEQVDLDSQNQNKTVVCSASLFLDPGAASKAVSVTDNAVTYSVASSTGAGAGNRYLETVYALPGTSPCIAVRYFIHYSVFENYPAGTIREFDQASLSAQFDAIRRTLEVKG